MQRDIPDSPGLWKWLYRGSALLLIALVALYVLSGTSSGPAGGGSSLYYTDHVSRGPIRATVTALGKVKARTTVEVGSQLSGQVTEIYVDHNDEVSEGQVIAQIDPGTFQSRLNEARARLQLAQSELRVQRASVRRAEAALAEQEANWERKRFLHERGHISGAALDTAKREVESARASLEMERARITRVEANVAEAQSAIVQAELDLKRAKIRAPTDGVIIEKKVEPGQTVAANFQAPLLFRIAEDLSQMLVEASIDEADIGLVAEGQAVTFTVEAYPDRVFEGEVRQVRKAPVDIQNVVTYTTVIAVENSDLALLPGMTATVEIETSVKENVLRIPSVALVFTPMTEGFTPLAGGAPARNEGGTFWVLNAQGGLEPHTARLGLRDDKYTELIGADVSEGTVVVTGLRQPPGV